MSDKPTWEPLWLQCKACGHQWDDWQPRYVPVQVWVAHIKALAAMGCPQCRHDSLYLRNQPLKPPGFVDT